MTLYNCSTTPPLERGHPVNLDTCMGVQNRDDVYNFTHLGFFFQAIAI